MTHNHRTQKGFTLIEILVAVFVVSLSLAFFGVAVHTTTLIRGVKLQDTALRIASSKIESVRGGGYDNVPSSGSFSDPLLMTLPNATGTVTTIDYNADIKQVTVTVGWRETKGTLRNISLTTLIGKVGGL